MNRYKIAVLGLLFHCSSANAQEPATLLQYGSILYERTTNQHALLLEDPATKANGGRDAMFSKFPKMAKSYFRLDFDSMHSVYRLQADLTRLDSSLWLCRPDENEVIVQNLTQKTTIGQRQIGDDLLLSIRDQRRRYDWKITGEAREIAGFECTKAVCRISDSVYVVAFFTDQILPAAGPETMGGLPGMILGLAVPRLHTTWYATKIELKEPDARLFPKKFAGKEVTWAETDKIVQTKFYNVLHTLLWWKLL